MALRSPLLLSSPPRFEQAPIFLSSSPDIPPLASLLKKKSPPLPRTGSNAAKIPMGVVQGFISARSLQIDPVEESIEVARDETKPRKRRKPSVEKPKGGDDAGSALKEGGEKVVKEGSPSSQRLGRFTFGVAEVIDEEGHSTSKPELARVATEPSQISCMTHVGKRPASRTGRGSRVRPAEKQMKEPYLEKLNNGLPGKQEQSDREQQRQDNGKNPEQGHEVYPVNEAVQNNFSAESAQDIETPASDSQRAWACQDADSKKAKSSKVNQDKLDLKTTKPRVSSSTTQDSKANESSDTPKKKKPKPANKSLRTVTARAIAQYQVSNEDENKQEQSDIVEHFAGSQAEKARFMLDPGSKKKAKKEPPERRKKLLDPAAAQARAERQDTFFGTSSQLVRDEPVEHVRELQQAEESSLRDLCEDICTNTTTKNRLWSAGARGDEMALLEAEAPSVATATHDEPKPEAAFLDIDDLGDTPEPKKLRTVHVLTGKSNLRCMELGADGGLSTITSSKAVLHSIPLNVVNPRRPMVQGKTISGQRNYGTNKQSTKQDDKEGVTSPKKRGRPRKDDATSATSPKKTTKRKRGKREQVPVIGDQEVNDEAVGFEDEQPKPKTGKPKARRKPKLARKEEREAFLANEASQVFAAITTTVKSQSIDKDPERLTWHEKMLLYDPIVLEDLTAWLNQEQAMTAAKAELGDDDQGLEAWMVQLWCEDKSVCCLWREGLRGGVKAKY